MINIATKIKDMRSVYGLTQGEIANKLGKSITFVSQLESEKAICPKNFMCEMANFLKVTDNEVNNSIIISRCIKDLKESLNDINFNDPDMINTLKDKIKQDGFDKKLLSIL